MFESIINRIKSWTNEVPYVTRMILRHGWPSNVIIPKYGALGDHLMMTTVLHEMYRRRCGRTWLLSNHQSLFQNNPSVSNVLPENARNRWILNRMGVPSCSTYFSAVFPQDDYEVPPPSGRHILSCLCQTAGINGKVALRPYIYLTKSEKRRWLIYRHQAVIHSASLGAMFPMATKQWFPERFQEVVNALKHKISFIQLGQTCEPPLDNVLDLRGRTTVREAAAILSNSRVFIGLVGFLMHLSRAVECRSVIVHSGREGPEQSGYISNEHLFTEMECSRCWRFNNCPNSFECMNRIRPEEVVAAVHRQLGRYGTPLPVAFEAVPNAPLVLTDVKVKV